MTATVTTRIDEPLLKEIDELSSENQMDRATFLRNLIKKGLEEEKKKKVLQEYKIRKISLQRVAEKLDLSFSESVELINRENIPLDYSKEELEEDLKGLK